MNRPNVSAPDVDAGAWKRRLKVLAAILLGAGAIVGAVVATVVVAGLFDAAIYIFLFLLGLSSIWLTVLLVVPSLPGSMRSLLGVAHVALGQFATGGTVVIQDGNDYRLAVLDADRDRAFYDGEWHEDVDPDHNASMLAWQPFATALFKQSDEGDDELATAADGGAAVDVPSIPGVDDVQDDDGGATGWSVDLQRVFDDGVRKLGDVDLLEKTEEITERKQAEESSMGGWEPIVATMVGLILGAGTGYVVLIGV